MCYPLVWEGKTPTENQIHTDFRRRIKLMKDVVADGAKFDNRSGLTINNFQLPLNSVSEINQALGEKTNRQKSKKRETHRRTQ